MNCAWCGAHADGTDSHGICDNCMRTVFNVNPEIIHKEIAEEEKDKQTKSRCQDGL